MRLTRSVSLLRVAVRDPISPPWSGSFESLEVVLSATETYAEYVPRARPIYRVDLTVSGSLEISEELRASIARMRSPNVITPGRHTILFDRVPAEERDTLREELKPVFDWDAAAVRYLATFLDAFKWLLNGEVTVTGLSDILTLDGETLDKGWSSLPGRYATADLDVSRIDETCKHYHGNEVEVGVLREAAELARRGVPEPVRLYLEGSEARLSPRLQLMILVAAAEWAVKSRIVAVKPDLEWVLTKLPSPPILKLVREYLPTILPAFNEAAFGSEDRRNLKDAVEWRNRMVHGSNTKVDEKSVDELLAERWPIVATSIRRLVKALTQD